MKEKWLAFIWPNYHIYQAIAPMKAWMFDFAKYGSPLSKMAVTYEKGTTSFFMLKKEYEANGLKFFEKVKKNPDVMFKVLKSVNEAAENIFKMEKELSKIDIQKLSDKELIKIHNKLFRWDEVLWRSGQIQNLLEFHNNYLSEYTKNLIIKKFGKENEARYFSLFTVSDYQSVSNKQDSDFFKLIKFYRNGKLTNPEKSIKNHWLKYRWMIYGWTGPALNNEYFLNNFKEAIKSKKINITEEKGVNKSTIKNKILKEFSKNDQKLILLLQKLLEAKAKRVDAHSLTYFLGDQIRNEIAKRTFISQKQMYVVPPFETEKLFKQTNHHSLNTDSNFHLYWFEKNKLNKLSEKEGRKKFNIIKKSLPKPKKVNELKGELAYPGKVKGMARLVLQKSDFDKFKKGEILVTRITDPNYVPLMKMAKAIITDIGGITSHASIVARELKKPCVIGTKIVTQILKDGDLVEVDANKGIVKIIK